MTVLIWARAGMDDQRRMRISGERWDHVVEIVQVFDGDGKVGLVFEVGRHTDRKDPLWINNPVKLEVLFD